MGLLDEAIREHLDLKRQHGAAEDELSRQETEALGPVSEEDIAAEAPDAVAAEVDAEGGWPFDRAATDQEEGEQDPSWFDWTTGSAADVEVPSFISPAPAAERDPGPADTPTASFEAVDASPGDAGALAETPEAAPEQRGAADAEEPEGDAEGPGPASADGEDLDPTVGPEPFADELGSRWGDREPGADELPEARAADPEPPDVAPLETGSVAPELLEPDPPFTDIESPTPDPLEPALTELAPLEAGSGPRNRVDAPLEPEPLEPEPLEPEPPEPERVGPDPLADEVESLPAETEPSPGRPGAFSELGQDLELPPEEEPPPQAFAEEPPLRDEVDAPSAGSAPDLADDPYARPSEASGLGPRPLGVEPLGEPDPAAEQGRPPIAGDDPLEDDPGITRAWSIEDEPGFASAPIDEDPFTPAPIEEDPALVRPPIEEDPSLAPAPIEEEPIFEPLPDAEDGTPDPADPLNDEPLDAPPPSPSPEPIEADAEEPAPREPPPAARGFFEETEEHEPLWRGERPSVDPDFEN